MTVQITDNQLAHMITKFLQWKLPEDFHPDCGISFQKFHAYPPDNSRKYNPVGTNLLTAMQAKAMIEHMLEDMPE